MQIAVDRLIADFGAKVYKDYLPLHLASTVYDHRHTVPAEVIFPPLFWYSGTPPAYQYPLDIGDFPGSFDTIVDPPLAPTITLTNEFEVTEFVNINTAIATFPDTMLAAFEQNGQFFYVWARDAI